MTDINALINRIDQEIAAEVGRQKTGWAELLQANRERELATPALRNRGQTHHRAGEASPGRLHRAVQGRGQGRAHGSRTHPRREPDLRRHRGEGDLTLRGVPGPGREPYPPGMHPGNHPGGGPLRQAVGPGVSSRRSAGRCGRPVVRRSDRRLCKGLRCPRAPGRSAQGATQGRVRRGPRRQDSVPEVPGFVHAGARRADLLLRGRGDPPGVRETAGGDSNKGGDIHGHNDSVSESERGPHDTSITPRHRFRAGPGALSRPGWLRPGALGSTGRGTAAGHGQLSRRARGHGLRGLHGPDGRGRFRRAAGPRLGLPGQGQLQGRGAGQEGGRALRDRPAHLPGRS